MFGLTVAELKILRRLKSPKALQDFLDALTFNFDAGRDQLRSPRRVLRERSAHCIEGALLAAAALWVNGARPWLLDLRATAADLDHVVALYRRFGCWGALSKTNHGVLRFREPIYRTVRELALSYFHEYFLNNGRKTLRDYSEPFDLGQRFGQTWLTRQDDLWDVAEALDASRHNALMSAAQIRNLRPADPIEIAAGKLLVFPEVQPREK